MREFLVNQGCIFQVAYYISVNLMYNSSKSVVKDLSLCQLAIMTLAKFLSSSPKEVLICLVPSCSIRKDFFIKSGIRGIFSLSCEEGGSSTTGI